MVMQVLKTHISMRRRLLKKFLTERAVSKFLEQNRSVRRITSPVMLTPSKRDLHGWSPELGRGLIPCSTMNLNAGARLNRKLLPCQMGRAEPIVPLQGHFDRTGLTRREGDNSPRATTGTPKTEHS